VTCLLLFSCLGLLVLFYRKVDKADAPPVVEEPNRDETDRRYFNPSNSPNN
jgi:hypothetical protein